MISGPLPLDLVAAVLGKRRADLEDVTEGPNALPLVTIDARKKPVRKVYFSQLLAWMNNRSTRTWTSQDLEDEIERCRAAKSSGTGKGALKQSTAKGSQTNHPQ